MCIALVLSFRTLFFFVPGDHAVRLAKKPQQANYVISVLTQTILKEYGKCSVANHGAQLASSLLFCRTVIYGGYFLLTQLINSDSGYMQNALRQNLFRAGHAHAGILLVLSLVGLALCR
jgi:hypothetical protein